MCLVTLSTFKTINKAKWIGKSFFLGKKMCIDISSVQSEILGNESKACGYLFFFFNINERCQRHTFFFFLESETNITVAADSAFPISGMEKRAESAGQRARVCNAQGFLVRNGSAISSSLC